MFDPPWGHSFFPSVRSATVRPFCVWTRASDRTERACRHALKGTNRIKHNADHNEQLIVNAKEEARAGLERTQVVEVLLLEDHERGHLVGERDAAVPPETDRFEVLHSPAIRRQQQERSARGKPTKRTETIFPFFSFGSQRTRSVRGSERKQ